MTADLDPRWEWSETRRLGGRVDYHRGRCRHLAEYVVPVEADGEVVAHLCMTCDAQLPAEWQDAWRP